MKIGGIDFQPEIMHALGEGTLVVFAGAGVSIVPPSNYPDFAGLVDEIAGTTYKRKKEEPFDHFLGRIQHERVNVHDQAKKLLTNPDSKPNPYHTAVVKLFANGKPLRIITTNFDMHFTTVIKNLGHSINTFQAPALPVGSRFEGLAYIHGSVDDSAGNLVLTDSDFGRAYVTEGWARRFLQGVYGEFTVLFIGYSHNDVVLSYLTRGLSTNNLKLYALSPDDAQVAHWNYLGIEPVKYQRSDGENPHINLLEGIQRLAETINMGMVEHEERVKQILSTAPPVVDSEDDDYLKDIVNDPVKVVFFTRHADSKEWMIWAEKRGILSPLFQANTYGDIRITKLAYWFAEKYLLKDPDSVLGLFQRNNQSMSPTLWGAITHTLHTDNDFHKDVIKKWLPLLIQYFPLGAQADSLEYLFDKCAANDLNLALLLFEFLSKPQIKLERGFSVSDDGEERSTSSNITTLGGGFCLSEALEKHFKTNMDKIAGYLIQITSGHIRTAFELGKLHGIADKTWDSLSYRRSAIEPNEQDEYPDDFSPVIDACRESLSWLVKNKNGYAKQIIDEWVKSPVPLLRRLAVFGKTEDI